MAKLCIVLLVSLCWVQAYYAARLTRDASSSDNSDDSSGSVDEQTNETALYIPGFEVEICIVLDSFDYLATVDQAAELTTVEMTFLRPILEKSRTIVGDRTKRLTDHRRRCTYFKRIYQQQGIVSPTDQQEAEVLGFYIEFYKKFAEIRKNSTLNQAGRLNAMLLTCDEIDKNERGWDHSVTENQTYTPEQLTEFDRKLTSLRTADASQRFEFIRDTCVFLNKTHSNEELARLAGFTPQQLRQILGHRDTTDHLTKARVKAMERICAVINPEDALAENETELTAVQEQIFNEVSNTFSAAPLTEKLSAIREICDVIRQAVEA